jgi:peptidoglycan/LPS O-acetylase OafA/YrhL
MSEARAVETRLGGFDTLRLIFAVLVILSHSFFLVRDAAGREPLLLLTRGQISLGNASVLAFFAISGFLIAKSWMRHPSPVDYLCRRVARIYPGFLVCGLVSLLIVVPLAGGSLPRHFEYYANYVVQTLTLQEFAHGPIFTSNVRTDVLNGSLWSVRTEFWCYIGLMFLGMTTLIRRTGFLFLALAGAMSWHLLQMQGHAIGNPQFFASSFGNPFDWSNVLPCFLGGMLFHRLGGPVLIRRNYMTAAVLVLILSNFIPYAFVFTLPICGTYLLMGVAFSPALQLVHLGRYGDFSYGTYLYAYPVQQLIVRLLGTSISPIALFLLATPVSLGLGALSWFLVERRFLSRSALVRHTGQTFAGGNRTTETVSVQ